jgi:hypothetical protein
MVPAAFPFWPFARASFQALLWPGCSKPEGSTKVCLDKPAILAEQRRSFENHPETDLALQWMIRLSEYSSLFIDLAVLP